MLEKAIFAGFGGQGVMLMGQILAQSVLDIGLEVSWLPSYGPEMRGGTANCAVVVSDKPIGSPVIYESTTTVAMNLPSMEKFESTILPDGLLLVNSSLIDKKSKRSDIRAHYVPVNEIADKLGNLKIANMVMLGAYIKATGICKPEDVVSVLKKKLTGPKAHLVELNEKGIYEGMSHVN
jgi:2-oxoglutarate ferredoxin oxidoreductase subunit gamma